MKIFSRLLLARYIFSGFLAFTTNLVLLFVFKNYLHWWYLTASTLAFIISVIVSFMAQKFITFRDKSTSRVPHQIALYFIIALFNVFANGVLMFSFVDIAHIQYLLSQVFSAGMIAIWSFALYRFVIFPNVKIL